jgi:hypothetical protein
MSAWTRRLMLPLLGPFLRPVGEGAAPLLWAATAPRLSSGVVFDRHGRHVRLNRASADAAAAESLWQESVQLLGLTPWQ